jgi:hypothetical protein
MRVRNSVETGARGVCGGRASDRGDVDRDGQDRQDSEAEPANDSLRESKFQSKQNNGFFFQNFAPQTLTRKTMAFETNQFKHSAFGASARRSLNNNNNNVTSTSTTTAFSTLAPKPTSHPHQHHHHAQPALAQQAHARPPLDSLPTVVLRNRHAFAPPQSTAVSASAAATALQLHESAFSAAAKEKLPLPTPTVRKSLSIPPL